MFCTDTCNRQPLGEVLYTVEIWFVMSLLNDIMNVFTISVLRAEYPRKNYIMIVDALAPCQQDEQIRLTILGK